MTPPPAVAVVGCGRWGRNLVRNFAELGSLRWVCDADPAALDAQAAAHPGVRATRSLEDALADPGLDAVVVATPAGLHHPHAKAALEAGKDVFIEKPLALRERDGRELVELAAARDAVLMVGHILEYHPAIVRLEALVRSGELGALWYVYSNRLNLGRVRQEENILWSFAPHDIAVISSLVGAEPDEVSAVGGTYLQPGIADVTVTNLGFEGGVRAHIFVSWLHPYKEQRLVVVGDRKMAVFEDGAGAPSLKLYDKGIEWRGGVPEPRQAAEQTLAFDAAEPMRLECEHFLDCVRERRRPLTDGGSGLRVLRVLEAAQRSLEAGGVPVALGGAEPAAARALGGA